MVIITKFAEGKLISIIFIFAMNLTRSFINLAKDHVATCDDQCGPAVPPRMTYCLRCIF